VRLGGTVLEGTGQWMASIGTRTWLLRMASIAAAQRNSLAGSALVISVLLVRPGAFAVIAIPLC